MNINSLSESKVIDPKQASDILGINTKALAYMRSAGTGPSYLKLGKKVYYFESVVNRFASKPEEDDLELSPSEVAAWIQVSESTLCDMRESGGGPKYTRRGRAVQYRSSDVAAYLVSCVRYTTGR